MKISEKNLLKKAIGNRATGGRNKKMIPYKQIIQEQEDNTDFEETFIQETVKEINKNSPSIKQVEDDDEDE